MKSFIAATIAALVSADQSDFPADSWNHARCHVTASFDVDCASLYEVMLPMISSWDPEPLDTPGYYTVYEDSSDVYIWSQRLTYNQVYIDDQLFDFYPQGTTGCQIVGRSRSEAESIGDNGVNFCNLWNVYNGEQVTDIATVTIDDVFNCSQDPSDPVTNCARYEPNPLVQF